MKFNINNTIKIKLTKKGKQILQKEYDELNAKLPADCKRKFELPKEDKNGYSSWPLWSVMGRFGPHIYLGCEVPFDTEILFDE